MDGETSAAVEAPHAQQEARATGQVRVLFANRLYWPDTHLLRTLVIRLAKNGYGVDVLAEQPTYKKANLEQRLPAREKDFGVSVRRLGVIPGARSNRYLLFLDKALFPLRALLHIIGRRLRGQAPDYIVVQTMPPVLIGLAGAVAAKIAGARMIYHFQDIYPELAAAHGMTREGGWLYRLAMAADRWNMRRAHRIVTLSTDMVETLTSRGIPREKFVIINNFLSDDFASPPSEPPEEFRRQPGVHRVIFAGNLGRFQHLDAVVDAARILDAKRSDIEFVFMGDGVKAAELRARAEGLSNVRFFPHQPVETANTIVQDATVGLVTLSPGIHRYAFPSKTLTYMALGVPVVAVIEEDSELSRLVREHRIGACAPGHSPEAVAEAVVSAVDTCDGSPEGRERIRTLYQSLYSIETAVEKWKDVLV